MAKTSKTKSKQAMGNEQPQDLVKKSVSFSERVRVRALRNVKTYNKKEKKQLWYSQKELATLYKEIRGELLLLAALKKAESDEDDNSDSDSKFCLRGLEHKTMSGAVLKLQIRKLSADAVFSEQQRQRNQRIDEEGDSQTIIAQAYSKYSQSAAYVARKMGIQDEKDAMLPKKSSSMCMLGLNELSTSQWSVNDKVASSSPRVHCKLHVQRQTFPSMNRTAQ